MPNITGNPGYQANESYISGAFYKPGNNQRQSKFEGSGTGNDIQFAASASNPIYGNSSTVTPLSLSSIFIIKY